MKKIIPVVLIGLVIAGAIIAVSLFGTCSATFHLNDGHEWTDVSFEVTEGEADKLTASMEGPQELKVTYDGDSDLHARFTLSNAQGESACYELHMYHRWDSAQDKDEVVTDFWPLQ